MRASIPIPDQEPIKFAERDFHNRLYAKVAVDYFPPTAAEFCELFRRVHLTPFHQGGWSYWSDTRDETFGRLGDVSGKRVLDYGCGAGDTATYLALHGAEVWGFDFAASGIERAKQFAARYGLSERTHFECMDAEALTYPSDFFDIVVGIGVLHHVIKYSHAAGQTFRILKPDGRAVFVETLWDNPLINFARRFSSLEKEAGDAPLTHATIKRFAHAFSSVNLRKRHLLYMLKRIAKLPPGDMQSPLRPRPLWKAVRSIDRTLLGLLPPLRFFCGEVIVELRK